MRDDLTGKEIDIAVKFALQTVARAALKELVIARGVGGWLDELEENIMLALKNRSFPGVPMEREGAVVDCAEPIVKTLILEAKGFRGGDEVSVMIID